MKIFTGGILTETNTFSPLPTGLAAFELDPPSNSLRDLVAAVCKERHWTHISGLIADAHPGAAVARAAYENLRDLLLEQIKSALPLDIVLLDLHGGMVAQGYDDCEGDLLLRIRDIVGDACVIGARLDPHSQFSDDMVRKTNLLCFYKENPHTDISQRAHDLLRLAIDTAEKRVNPVISTFDCQMVDVFQTNREPMQSFVNRLREMEGTNGILDISLVHGFRRADTPLMGTHMLVITDNDAALGDKLAEELGMEVFAMRGNAAQPVVPLGEAVALAMASEGPTILADLADNPGGGAPGDSTYIFNAVRAAGARRIALGYLVDPLALDYAFEAGVGAKLIMRLGGKACALSGDPVDLSVEIKGLQQDAALTSVDVPIGRAAWLVHDEIDIVVIGVRWQTYAPDLFTQFGIDLASKQVIIVKSAQHYHPYFHHITDDDIVVDAPGVCASDWRNLPFQRVRRSIWPFTDDPFRTNLELH